MLISVHLSERFPLQSTMRDWTICGQSWAPSSRSPPMDRWASYIWKRKFIRRVKSICRQLLDELTILSAGPLRLCAEGSEQWGFGSVFLRRVRQAVQASRQSAAPQTHTQGHPQVSVLWEGGCLCIIRNISPTLDPTSQFSISLLRLSLAAGTWSDTWTSQSMVARQTDFLPLESPCLPWWNPWACPPCIPSPWRPGRWWRWPTTRMAASSP